MDLLIAALVVIFVIKFGWGLVMFCFEHWILAILIFFGIVAFFA